MSFVFDLSALMFWLHFHTAGLVSLNHQGHLTSTPFIQLLYLAVEINVLKS